MYGPTHIAAKGGEVLGETPPMLLRLRSPLVTIGLAMGLGVGIAFAAMPFLPAQYRAETRLAAMGSTEEAVRSSMAELRSSASLDNVIRALNLGRGDDFSINRPSVATLVSDVFSGTVTTVSEAEDATRKRLQDAVFIDYDPAEKAVVIAVEAGNANTASAIAKRLKDEFRRLVVVYAGAQSSPELAAMRRAAERAESAVSGFTANLGAPTLARLKTLQESRAELAAEIEAVTQHLAELTAKQQAASSMKLADVLAGPLPDSLEFTGVEYERQRYVQAELEVQRLSIDLGPKHPRRAAAQGALDGARRDIGSALARLDASLKEQVASSGASLETLQARRTALSSDRQLDEQARQLASLQAAAGEARRNLDKAAATPATSSSAPASPPRVIASVAAERLGPVPWLLAACGGLVGLVAGMALLARRYRAQSRLADALEDVPVDLPLAAEDLSVPVTPADVVFDQKVPAETIEQSFAIEAGGRFAYADDLHESAPIEHEPMEERLAANSPAFGDRMREMLLDNRLPVAQASLPPLIDPLVTQSHERWLEEPQRLPSEMAAADIDEAPAYDMGELLELQRELQELRELVRLHGQGGLKATG